MLLLIHESRVLYKLSWCTQTLLTLMTRSADKPVNSYVVCERRLLFIRVSATWENRELDHDSCFFSYKQKLATSSEATQPVRPPSSKRVRKKTCRWHSVVRFHDPYPLAVGVGRILLAMLNDRVWASAHFWLRALNVFHGRYVDIISFTVQKQWLSLSSFNTTGAD